MKVIIVTCFVIGAVVVVNAKPLEDANIVKNGIESNIDDESEEIFNSVKNQPSISSSIGTIEEFQNLGVNVTDVEPDILQDALLSVVSVFKKFRNKQMFTHFNLNSHSLFENMVTKSKLTQ